MINNQKIYMFLKNSDNVGRLEVICGSMFSGKSEELIRRLRRESFTKQNVLIFKHAIDKRYGENGIFSHSQDSIGAFPVSNVLEMESIISKHPDVEVIGIDEVQFFGKEVIEFCNKYVNIGKRVIVAGLDLDFKAEPFYPMPELLTYADSITKLKAICMVCGKEAYASQRLINGEPAFKDDPIVMVGASENYEARCRRHHIVRDRKDTRAKIYFLFGTDINAGKEEVEKFISSKNPNAKTKTISIFKNEESVIDLRNSIEKSSYECDILFIRIIKSPLMPIEGDYSIIDLMSEYRKISSVILISRNRRGMINEVLISHETIRKADLNLEDIYFTPSENPENEKNIYNIEKIIKAKAVII
ncbi:thymidine kinase [Streptobacillus ratti]|uniref:thymidine kinase n=2 Tax=Streptobacillus ratti TaxID=1720557 RepID=UPI001ABFDC17